MYRDTGVQTGDPVTSIRAISPPFHARHQSAPVVVAIGSPGTRLIGRPGLALALVRRLLFLALPVLWIHEELRLRARCWLTRRGLTLTRVGRRCCRRRAVGGRASVRGLRSPAADRWLYSRHNPDSRCSRRRSRSSTARHRTSMWHTPRAARGGTRKTRSRSTPAANIRRANNRRPNRRRSSSP